LRKKAVFTFDNHRSIYNVALLTHFTYILTSGISSDSVATMQGNPVEVLTEQESPVRLDWAGKS